MLDFRTPRFCWSLARRAIAPGFFYTATANSEARNHHPSSPGLSSDHCIQDLVGPESHVPDQCGIESFAGLTDRFSVQHCTHINVAREFTEAIDFTMVITQNSASASSKNQPGRHRSKSMMPDQL
jgi:hypothetical protein